jgi:hypothetical protein
MSKRQPVSYKRFDTAAEAIRYAIEELAPELLVGAYLEVEEERFDSVGIRNLYASAAYPLPRRDLQQAQTPPASSKQRIAAPKASQ